MMIVGLIGKKRHGKTEAANALVNGKNNFIKLSFADPLRSLINSLIEWYNYSDYEKEHSFDMGSECSQIAYDKLKRLIVDPVTAGTDVYRYQKSQSIFNDMMTFIEINKLFPITLEENKPRQLLQKLGTEFFRWEVDQDIWIKIMESNIRDVNGKNNIVIDDCRFVNEAEMISNLGGYLVRIIRPSIPCVDEHESEKQMDLITTFDGCVINDTNTLEEFHKMINAYIPSLVGITRIKYI